MTDYNQLTLWNLLEEGTESPTTVRLNEVWQALEDSLTDLSVEQQLVIGAEAINKVASILASRAELLLQDWRDQDNPEGPMVGTELFAGLVRMSMQLDLEDLREPSVPQSFQPHGPHQKPSRSESENSIAAIVDKSKVLAMADDLMVEEQLKTLAGEEHIEKWQQAILQYLLSINKSVRLPILQQALGIPMVEVWMGLLLGGFEIEQLGEFYENQNVWVTGQPSTKITN
jgi:hypothetical protein